MNILTEFCNGGDLTAQIKKKSLTASDKNLIALNTIQGLVSIHKEGVAHCDLHPGNILLVVDPATGKVTRAVISDFGLCRPKMSKLMTESDAMFQNEYLPPEVPMLPKDRMNGFEHEGDKHDVYALGCCLYEMVNGVPPPWIALRRKLMEEHQNQSESMAELKKDREALTTMNIPQFEIQLKSATSQTQRDMINKELIPCRYRLEQVEKEIDVLTAKKEQWKAKFASV